MILINKVARTIVETVPFPRAQTLASSLEPVTGESDIRHEITGFAYNKHVRELKDAARLAESRARVTADAATPPPADSSMPAPPATGMRRTSAKKCQTQNLLNAVPLPPTTPAEIELMLRCVSNSQKAKSRKSSLTVCTHSYVLTRLYILAHSLLAHTYVHRLSLSPRQMRIAMRSSPTAQRLKMSAF